MRNILVVLFFLLSFYGINKSYASSCIIADPQDTALNVRATPNGKVINRLRNGRIVEITRSKNDAKGRPWGYAEGLYNGKYRKWGWVFMAAVDCQGNRSVKVSKPPSAELKCVVADPVDPTLNVRSTPNGTLINRLKNGREIRILRTKNDTKGRPWGYAVGHYKGQFREWGWVFMQNVDCDNIRIEPKEYWIQVASRELKSEAIELAKLYAPNFNQTTVFSSANDWYAIVIKTVPDNEIQTTIEGLKSDGKIPGDSYATEGKSFVQKIWHTTFGGNSSGPLKPIAKEKKPVTVATPQLQKEFDAWLSGS